MDTQELRVFDGKPYILNQACRLSRSMLHAIFNGSYPKSSPNRCRMRQKSSVILNLPRMMLFLTSLITSMNHLNNNKSLDNQKMEYTWHNDWQMSYV